MNVNVVIPTYKTRDTIFRLLTSLEKQSYKDFNVMVVYKKWEGYKDTLSKIKAYDKLDINFVEQDEGLFEEALNTIYRKADGDIVIHTDDDAYASKKLGKRPYRTTQKAQRGRNGYRFSRRKSII